MRNCSYDILMIDDRPFKRFNRFQAPYWVISAALNFAYAQEHGHGFHLVQPLARDSLHKGWNRVLYINELLQTKTSECKWILYLDNDALIRSTSSLQSVVERLLRLYQPPQNLQSSMIIASERSSEWSFNLTLNAPAWSGMNTGAFFFRADNVSAELFARWLARAQNSDRKRFWFEWPAEQGILTELLIPGSFPSAAPPSLEDSKYLQELRRAVVVVNITEINSPWGRDIQHWWGSSYEAAAVRDWAVTDALLRSGKADALSFGKLVREVVRRSSFWSRPALSL